MSVKPATSYRLNKARAASHRLAEAAVVQQQRSRRSKPIYSRFALDKAIPSWSPASSRSKRSDQIPLPPIPDHGFFTMTEVLRWCRDAADAETCFVVDAQGFVLEYDGITPYKDMEDLGSQLTVILSRADETESAGSTRKVELDYESLHLTGIRLSGDDNETLTLVIVSDHPVPAATSGAIASELAEHVYRL
jgi:hypothetical protein